MTYQIFFWFKLLSSIVINRFQNNLSLLCVVYICMYLQMHIHTHVVCIQIITINLFDSSSYNVSFKDPNASEVIRCRFSFPSIKHTNKNTLY